MSRRQLAYRSGLRTPIVVMGLVSVVVAIMADRFGLGQPDSFGRGQVLLILGGCLLVAGGLLGKRFVPVYRDTAVILLNTLLLLAALEFAAIVLARSGILPDAPSDPRTQYLHIPYYAEKDWSGIYWSEATQAESYRYSSYTGWSHLPFQGQTINIDDQGRRRTPGSECKEESLKIFTFGGSTMWGWGSPDWATIPAYLGERIASATDQPVCVLNLAEDGYVSSQGLISLVRELQAGNLPDIVVFYDGVNDLYATFRTGLAGVHPYVPEFESRFQNGEDLGLRWLQSSRLFSLVRNLVKRFGDEDTGSPLGPTARPGTELDMDVLSREIVSAYLGNCKLVEALASTYGFRVFFFWQPLIATGNKPFTKEEEEILGRLDPQLVALTRETVSVLSPQVGSCAALRDLSAAFDSVAQQIWIDEWGHITPEGNRIVADRMLGSTELARAVVEAMQE
jgi:hypothetical protein